MQGPMLFLEPMRRATVLRVLHKCMRVCVPRNCSMRDNMHEESGSAQATKSTRATRKRAVCAHDVLSR
eukprot:12926742-Prorocentrum_lima.AAC.1